MEIGEARRLLWVEPLENPVPRSRDDDEQEQVLEPLEEPEEVVA
jgi:hypothetical protein